MPERPAAGPDEPDRTGPFEGAPPAPVEVISAGVVVAGRYKLLEALGEGGMGAVWMAQQTEPVKRLVAVKLIKTGMDSKTVLARFEAERQALSMMDHPHIARVLDVGATATGRPFLVMELVKGTLFTEFCDKRKLTLRQRLELFVPVCYAIQHAHQKGVIHRDIKPSNVLVTLHDDKPVPKVIDFGVAKATGQPLTEKTLHTGFEQVVGTPAYMSPEQATFNQLDIDTRSDVYSLGVLLYELLTGTTPIERERFKQAAILEMLRVVREEEPPRPSTRLSATEARASIAAVRGTEPASLSKLLRAELDWIVMKALEKDRSRRYATATNFAEDVQRYLAGEPVLAHPPSAGYRVRKFVRRHRGPVVAAALVLLALVGGAVGITLALAEASRHEAATAGARADAKGYESLYQNAEEQQRFAALESQVTLINDWLSLRSSDDIEKGLSWPSAADRPFGWTNHDVQMPWLVERAARSAERRFPVPIGQDLSIAPLREVALLSTLAVHLSRAGDHARAARHQARAVELLNYVGSEQSGMGPDLRPMITRGLVYLLIPLADYHVRAGQLDEARTVLGRIDSLLRSGAPTPQSQVELQLAAVRGAILLAEGRVREAEEQLLTAFAGLESIDDGRSSELADIKTATIRRLMSLYVRLQQPDQVALWRARLHGTIAPPPRQLR